MQKQAQAVGGIGFGGALCLAFVVLKLCGVIAWSWWWVTAPLWAPLAVGAALALMAGLCFAVAALF